MVEPIVYIVDDDDAVRDSVSELVRSVKLRARTFPDAKSFLTIYTDNLRGCLVLDIRMSAMSGVILQKRLNALGATIPIIFITGHGDVELAVEALKSGAVDFIQKPYHEQNLLDTIIGALELDERQSGLSSSSVKFEKIYAKLTPREGEIFHQLVRGKTSKSIAKEIGISPRTVEIHRQHILHKYGIPTFTQLMSQYNHLGLLSRSMNMAEAE